MLIGILKDLREFNRIKRLSDRVRRIIRSFKRRVRYRECEGRIQRRGPLIKNDLVHSRKIEDLSKFKFLNRVLLKTSATMFSNLDPEQAGWFFSERGSNNCLRDDVQPK